MTSHHPLAPVLVTAAALIAAPALAQEAGFGLELNSLRAEDTGCRLTYVAENATGTDLAAVAFEVAIFDSAGMVSRLVILEFGGLTNGKTRVVQFDIADQGCDDISRLLVNDVAECRAVEGDAPDCLAVLAPGNRTGIDFGL